MSNCVPAAIASTSYIEGKRGALALGQALDS